MKYSELNNKKIALLIAVIALIILGTIVMVHNNNTVDNSASDASVSSESSVESISDSSESAAVSEEEAVSSINDMEEKVSIEDDASNKGDETIAEESTPIIEEEEVEADIAVSEEN